MTYAGPGFGFGKPFSHGPARPSLKKKSGLFRQYPKLDGLAAWDHCISAIIYGEQLGRTTGFEISSVVSRVCKRKSGQQYLVPYYTNQYQYTVTYRYNTNQDSLHLF